MTPKELNKLDILLILILVLNRQLCLDPCILKLENRYPSLLRVVYYVWMQNGLLSSNMRFDDMTSISFSKHKSVTRAIDLFVFIET